MRVRERAIALAEYPAYDDRMLELDAGGHIDQQALCPGGPRELGELVVGGQRVRAGQQVAHLTEVVGREAHGRAGAARGIGQLDRDVATLDELGDGVGALGHLVRGGHGPPVDRERGVGQLGGTRSMSACRGGSTRRAAPCMPRTRRVGRRRARRFVGSDAVDVLRG